MKRTNTYLLLIIIAIFCLTFTPAMGHKFYQDVTKVDLGVSSLTLEPGESYTFSVAFEPEDPGITRLYWFNSDETVVALDGLTNTVTALTPGTATLMAESFDRLSYALCEVTVSGPQGKDASEMVEGKSLVTISEADRAKIDVSAINRSLALLETLVLTEEAAQTILNRFVSVIADVREGTEEAESQRALALGMDKAEPLKKVHNISLRGTLAQLLEFVKDNENLVRIFKVRDIYIIPDPDKGSGGPRLQPKSGTMKEEDPFQNDTSMLRDHAEVLSSLSTIHNMGFTGKGTTIAVLDTGLDKKHEQFEGRVIAENCFATGGVYCKRLETEECQQAKYDGPCYDGNEDGICDDGTIDACYSCEKHEVCESGNNTSYPEHAQYLDEFNHGSNVAGIAAGMEGLARDANIVSVNIQSEYRSPVFADKERNPNGYIVSITGEDIYSSLAWLLAIQDGLRDEETPISIINMSLGGGNYDHICDHDEGIEELYDLMQKLTDQGILVAAAAGNEGYNTGITYPACMSNVIAVGALAGNETPYIVSFSNHSPMVEILAPGTEIHSAALVGKWTGPDPETNEPVYTCTGNNCYGEMSGTSQATPFVSGSLAMLMEAYPGMAPEDYLRILKSMSMKTVSERNSNDQYEYNKIDDEREKFGYSTPIVDFSGLKQIPQGTLGATLEVNDRMSGVITSETIETEERPAIIADMISEKAKVIVKGDVTVAGEDTNAIVAKVSEPESELSLAVFGNVSANNAAIVIDETSRGAIDILVTETIEGKKAGILIGDTAVYDTKTAQQDMNITITAYEVKPYNRVVVYEDGTRATDIEKDINYIIRTDQPDFGRIEVVEGNGDRWTQQTHDYDTAKPGQSVYFLLTPRKTEGFDPDKWNFDLFIGRNKLTSLGNGLYSTVVKNGGAVHVHAEKTRKSDPYHKTDHYEFFDIFDHHELPKTGFSVLQPQRLSAQPLNVNYKTTRLMLQLPTLDVRSDIVTVPYVGGEYPVEWLGSSVGMLEGSSIPGEGITVLTGHNHLNTTEAGPFALLRELEAGDSFMITDQRGSMQTWHVYKSVKIPADGLAKIAAEVKENALVLITCEDESPDGGYLNRRVVLAEL